MSGYTAKQYCLSIPLSTFFAQAGAVALPANDLVNGGYPFFLNCTWYVPLRLRMVAIGNASLTGAKEQLNTLFSVP